VAAATPLVARLAEAVDPPAVDAVACCSDGFPGLLASVDDDVLPLVRELHQVEPTSTPCSGSLSSSTVSSPPCPAPSGCSAGPRTTTTTMRTVATGRPEAIPS
jgi:hypothetical protein